MENIPFAVLSLAAGVFMAALVPMAIRKQRGPVFQKTLVGMVVAGFACVGLGLGGMVIASVAGASAVVTWLGITALIGVGIVLLAALAGTTQAIRRRVAVRRT